MAQLYKDSTKLVRKSEAAVEANRVLKSHIGANLDTINASVQASMKNRSYNVFVQYGESGVISSMCDCPLGKHKCYHVAAVLLDGNKNISKTHIRQSWLRRPKSAPPKDTRTVSEIFPLSKLGYKALSKPLSSEDRTFIL